VRLAVVVVDVPDLVVVSVADVAAVLNVNVAVVVTVVDGPACNKLVLVGAMLALPWLKLEVLVLLRRRLWVVAVVLSSPVP